MDNSWMQDCLYPAHFYRKMEREVDSMKSPIGRDKYITPFVVNLIREALAAGDDKVSCNGNGVEIGNTKGVTVTDKSLENPIIMLDSDSSDDTTFFDWTSEFDKTYFLPLETKAVIQRILQFTVEAKGIRGLGFDRQKFVNEFSLAVEFPPLELLWLLDNKFHLMSVSAYLIKLKSPKLEYFSRQLVSLCFSSCLHESGTSGRATEILDDLLRCVIISGYCNLATVQSLHTLKTMCTSIITEITKKLVDDDLSSLNHKFLIDLLQGAAVVHSIKKRHFSDQLLSLLLSPSNRTLTDTLQYQQRFASADENERKQSTITLLIGPPQTKYDVVEILRKAVRELNNVNWENLLHTITTWEKMCAPDSHEIFFLMKDLIRALIQVGLSELKEDEVMVAFILARHCCLISPVYFSRYEKWFAAMFEHDNSVTNTPEKFKFFIETMTKWIPIEPPMFLQVHVSYRPFIPDGCRTLWSDYSALARARIAEYNEIEEAMDFEPNVKNPVQHEVEMAIKEFDATNKLPNSISHMYFFRKQHYLGQFLPALVKLPTGAIVSDARFRLIEALNLDKKVPSNLYATYKSSFQK